MALTFHELKGKRLAQLRDIANDVKDERVQGFSQMNKDHLLPALCQSLGIEVHEHHGVTGIDKVSVKLQLRELKRQREAAARGARSRGAAQPEASDSSSESPDPFAYALIDQLGCQVVSLCRAGGAYRSVAPRPTRGKMHLRRKPYDLRSGSGDPQAGAQSVGRPGVPIGRGESAPPRIGAPAAHFSN